VSDGRSSSIASASRNACAGVCGHQGYRLPGRTPAQALQEAPGIAELPALTGGFIVSEGEEVTDAA